MSDPGTDPKDPTNKGTQSSIMVNEAGDDVTRDLPRAGTTAAEPATEPREPDEKETEMGIEAPDSEPNPQES